MQHNVFDRLPVFVVMDAAGLKAFIAAWLGSVEKVWTLQNLAAALLCLEDDRTTYHCLDLVRISLCLPLPVSLEMGNPSTPIDS